MRKLFRRYLPDHRLIHENRWLSPFRATLLHPRLWALNRHTAAGAVAVGLFCGLIPGPFQMIGAALGALLLHVNLPLALLCTLYSNPFTIVPLYLAAFGLGKFVLGLAGDTGHGAFVAPPPLGDAGVLAWLPLAMHWMAGLGRPLFIGLFLLAVLLAGAGYLAVRLLWRWHIVKTWRARRRSPA
jgi:uncharacterized protein (DUF2062 family)